jgi:hypothetical protein
VSSAKPTSQTEPDDANPAGRSHRGGQPPLWTASGSSNVRPSHLRAAHIVANRHHIRLPTGTDRGRWRGSQPREPARLPAQVEPDPGDGRCTATTSRRPRARTRPGSRRPRRHRPGHPGASPPPNSPPSTAHSPTWPPTSPPPTWPDPAPARESHRGPVISAPGSAGELPDDHET